MTPAPKRFRELGWETYAWLIYSLPFLFTSIARAHSRRARRACCCCRTLAFLLALFRRVFHADGRRSCGSSRASTRIAIVGSQWNPSAASFFIYGVGVRRATASRPRTAAKVLAGQVLIGGVASFALGMEWWFYMASMVISALIGAITIQARAKEAGDAKLRHGAGRSRAAREAGRARAHRARHARSARPHALGRRAQERAGAETDVARSGEGACRRWRRSSASRGRVWRKCARRSPAIDRRAWPPRSSTCAKR